MTRTVIRINGEPVAPASDAKVLSWKLRPGLYSILLDGASHEVRVDAGQATVGNRRFDYQVDDPAPMETGGATRLAPKVGPQS